MCVCSRVYVYVLFKCLYEVLCIFVLFFVRDVDVCRVFFFFKCRVCLDMNVCVCVCVLFECVSPKSCDFPYYFGKGRVYHAFLKCLAR